MTDDILTQLRKALEFYEGWRYLQCSTADLKRAADEIERLRTELADYKRTVRALEEQLAEETSGYE